MPYRESFAWAIVPLFENNNPLTSGGAASPSSPLAPSVSGSSSQDCVVEAVAKNTLDGKFAQYSSGSSVVVEISNLNKVKESYTEDLLQVAFSDQKTLCLFYILGHLPRNSSVSILCDSVLYILSVVPYCYFIGVCV